MRSNPTYRWQGEGDHQRLTVAGAGVGRIAATRILTQSDVKNYSLQASVQFYRGQLLVDGPTKYFPAYDSRGNDRIAAARQDARRWVESQLDGKVKNPKRQSVASFVTDKVIGAIGFGGLVPNPFKPSDVAKLSDDEFRDYMDEFYKSIPDSPRPLSKRYGVNYRNRPDFAEIVRFDNSVKSRRSSMLKQYKAMTEESNRRFHLRSKNPLFLPKSLFDHYKIRVVGESYEVTRIQTLKGAESKVKDVAKKYPCNEIEIVSDKFGKVVKSYQPSSGRAPKVKTDNTKDYAESAKGSMKFRLYVKGQEFGTYDTKKEAEKAGRDEGGNWRVKEVAENPGRITGKKITDLGGGFGLMTERSGFSGDLLYYPVQQKTSTDNKPFWSKVYTSAFGAPEYDFYSRASVMRFIKVLQVKKKNPTRYELGIHPAKRNNLTQTHLEELVNLGGRMVPRGQAYNDLVEIAKEQGHDAKSARALADRWMQGHDLKNKKQNPGSKSNPFYTLSFTGSVKLFDNPDLKGTTRVVSGYDDWEVTVLRSSGTKANRRALVEVYIDGKQYYGWVDWNQLVSRGNSWTKSTNPRARNGRDTSAAEVLYKDFHGKEHSQIIDYVESFEVPDSFAELGELVEIWVIPIKGRSQKSVRIAAPDPDNAKISDIVHLAASPNRKQMYFIGGDQDLDTDSLGFSRDDRRAHMVIGILTELTYRTRKGFHKFKLTDYFHKLGEDTGNEPFLTYDADSKKMGVAGGSYLIKDVGIVD